jgi:large subunit ribosomal protein L1
LYDVAEAVDLVLKSSFAKFDETVDVAVNLGVNPKYSDQMVRGAVSMPHGLGKTVSVVAFCKGENEEKALSAGAIDAGGDELVEEDQGRLAGLRQRRGHSRHDGSCRQDR